MVKVPVLVLVYPGFRSDCYSPCIGNACRGLRARAAFSIALVEEVGLLGSLTIRGGSLRDCR